MKTCIIKNRLRPFLTFARHSKYKAVGCVLSWAATLSKALKTVECLSNVYRNKFKLVQSSTRNPQDFSFVFRSLGSYRNRLNSRPTLFDFCPTFVRRVEPFNRAKVETIYQGWTRHCLVPRYHGVLSLKGRKEWERSPLPLPHNSTHNALDSGASRNYDS